MEKQQFKNKLKSYLLGADGIKSLLKNNQKLPHEVFVGKVMGAVMSDSELQKCDINSIVACAIKSAQLGLPVDAGGYAYLIAFKGQPTFQIGVKGYIELCKRNKNVLQIIHGAVYEGDEFDYWQDENGFHYKHKIALNGKYNREKKDGLICVYATIKYTNGGSETQIMDIKSIEAIKGCAQTSYIWDKWYTEKATTAVIKRLLKRQHLMNVQEALEKDDAEKEVNTSKLQATTVEMQDIEIDNIPENADEIMEKAQRELAEKRQKEMSEINTKLV